MSFLWIHPSVICEIERTKQAVSKEKLELLRRTFLAPGSLPDMKTKKVQLLKFVDLFKKKPPLHRHPTSRKVAMDSNIISISLGLLIAMRKSQ